MKETNPSSFDDIETIQGNIRALKKEAEDEAALHEKKGYSIFDDPEKVKEDEKKEKEEKEAKEKEEKDAKKDDKKDD